MSKVPRNVPRSKFHLGCEGCEDAEHRIDDVQDRIGTPQQLAGDRILEDGYIEQAKQHLQDDH